MIAQFWKGAVELDSQNDDAILREMRSDSMDMGGTNKFFYRLKPLIPRRLQIYLRKKRAQGTDRSIKPGIETMLCKPVIEQVRSSGRDFDFIWFWPDSLDMACVVTHDVESAYGFQRVLQLAEIDERCGFRSAFNFVCEKYPVDDGVIRELKDRGFEIGVHGVKHDGKLFLSEKVFKDRLKIMEKHARKWGAVGFRSPSLLRDISAMRSLPFEWDSSIPDWDPYGPQPGGCRTVFPFFLSARTLELPVTMMQDHTLFEILEESDDAVWKAKLSYISLLGGLATIIVHPDYIFEGERLKVYEGFLEYMRSRDRLWRARPNEICRWWKERDGSSLVDESGHTAVKGPAASRASVAAWSRISEKWARALIP